MNLITLIAFHPTGYELHIPVTFEELPATMRRLAARGYTPSREPVLTAEGLPICPRHGVPMQQRSKQGDFWFSHKMVHPETGETVYCRGYASASSPGYDILLPTAVPAEDAVQPDVSHPPAGDMLKAQPPTRQSAASTAYPTGAATHGRVLPRPQAASVKQGTGGTTTRFNQRP
ncbi:MAG: hypothetical protein IPM53_30015 [Anaerolineaceae bacterium]|nr:hypothetical protein [Anaerolineaceae bacterium]